MLATLEQDSAVNELKMVLAEPLNLTASVIGFTAIVNTTVLLLLYHQKGGLYNNNSTLLRQNISISQPESGSF